MPGLVPKRQMSIVAGNWLGNFLSKLSSFVALYFSKVMHSHDSKARKHIAIHTQGMFSSHPCLVLCLVPPTPKFLVYPSRISYAPTRNKSTNYYFPLFITQKVYYTHCQISFFVNDFLTHGGNISTQIASSFLELHSIPLYHCIPINLTSSPLLTDIGHCY